MSRLKEILTNNKYQANDSQSRELSTIIANLQDISQTLAMLYDLESEAAKHNQEMPEWLSRWISDFEAKHGMR